MFPRKLYQILCETDPAIISWDEDGTSWHIANYEEYIEGVMPLFYRHNKLTSFQRQLNLYGERERERRRRFPVGVCDCVRLCFRETRARIASCVFLLPFVVFGYGVFENTGRVARGSSPRWLLWGFVL